MDIRVKTIVLILSLVVGVLGADGILKMQNDTNNPNIGLEENKEAVNRDTEIKEESGVISANNENFEEVVLKSDKKVLIDFYATWCNPCKMLAPTIEEIAKENEDIKVVKVDIDEADIIAMNYGITSIPTLMVIENGEIKKQITGALSKEYIYQLLLNE